MLKQMGRLPSAPRVCVPVVDDLMLVQEASCEFQTRITTFCKGHELQSGVLGAFAGPPLRLACEPCKLFEYICTFRAVNQSEDEAHKIAQGSFESSDLQCCFHDASASSWGEADTSSIVAEASISNAPHLDDSTKDAHRRWGHPLVSVQF